MLFLQKDSGKGTMTDKSTQCQVKRLICTAQSNAAKGYTCCLPLFNQSNQPSCTYGSRLFSSFSTCQLRGKGDVQIYTVQDRLPYISEKWHISLLSQISYLDFFLLVIYSRAIQCSSVEATKKLHLKREERLEHQSFSFAFCAFSPLFFLITKAKKLQKKRTVLQNTQTYI